MSSRTTQLASGSSQRRRRSYEVHRIFCRRPMACSFESSRALPLPPLLPLLHVGTFCQCPA